MVVHHREGPHGTNLHLGDNIDTFNLKHGQQDTGIIHGITPTGLIHIHTTNGYTIIRSINKMHAAETN